MKIALLGYGLEGKATEKYLKTHFENCQCDIFEHFMPADLATKNFSAYDYVFRSPSVPPLHLPNETSATKYFFDHCPCPIIGVTATKGKGTICSFIKSLLDTDGADAYLVGNIGSPALDILDNLTTTSIVIYELSSFQLWDLEKSPHVAVIGHLEPDHLNVHRDYADYLAAKSNICRHQSSNDYCIFFKNNSTTAKLAAASPAHKIPYPFAVPNDITTSLVLPGEHNHDNALAAIAAVASLKSLSPSEYIQKHHAKITQGLSSFRGLPHRLEFVRKLNGVEYYDDNFSTNPSSLRVAIKAFPRNNLVVIVGGRDKTDNKDLSEIYEILQSPNIANIILLGESGRELMNRYHDQRFALADSLQSAIATARTTAESLDSPIVLMSPAAASFDMFENVYDRGDQFKNLVSSLTQ